MDLDHFKEINDTLGHHVGDLLLAQVAVRLRERLRQADIVARLGGDEFAVLLPGLDTRHATMAARLLLQALHDPFTVEEQNLSVGASVGIALYPDHGVDLHTLMQRADVAMYAAKRVNDGFAFYDAKLDTHAPSRFTLLGELRLALERREFRLFYQPKVNLANGEVIGVEALVRWKHPRDGLVLPDVFIPLMEQTGMLRALTPWMLGEALSLLEQADRLQRQFFRMGSAEAHVWEPPVDIVETADSVIVHVALPGVAADSITIGVEPDAVTVSALRPFAGAAPGAARIHRVEIPYGRFQRRVALPMHALQFSGEALANGCLTLTFAKRAARALDPRFRGEAI